jgi:predicted glycosyltransferase involved in capsule biosynthesis
MQLKNVRRNTALMQMRDENRRRMEEEVKTAIGIDVQKCRQDLDMERKVGFVLLLVLPKVRLICFFGGHVVIIIISAKRQGIV